MCTATVQPASLGLHGVYVVIIIIKFILKSLWRKLQGSMKHVCVRSGLRRNRLRALKASFVSGMGDISEKECLIKSKCFENIIIFPSIFCEFIVVYISVKV